MVLSLRARLVAGLVVLLLVGLLVADVATYALLQDRLQRRVDEQLYAGKNQAIGYLVGPPGGREAPHGGPPSFPPGTYIVHTTSDGTVLQEHEFDYAGLADITARPQLPNPLPADGRPPFTVAGSGQVPAYRVLVETEP